MAEGWRLNVPVTRPGDVEALVELGASELYCGLALDGCYLNRRPSREANLSSWAELAELVAEAHRLGRPVAFVANDIGYDDRFRRAMLDHASRAVEAGCDAVIVSDPVLLGAMAEWPVRRHLSSTAQVTNAAAVSFYAERAPLERVVLPRHLRTAEIAAVTREHPGLEFEAIVLGDPCHWDDGLCGFEHDLHEYSAVPEAAGGGCSKLYHVSIGGLLSPEEHEALARRYRALRRFTGCGLCALPALRETGVSVLKIAARDKPELRDILAKFCSIASLVADGDHARFRSVARDLRQRMAEQFLASAALRAYHQTPDATAIGTRVAAAVAESSLLSCDPPHSCYWPDQAEPDGDCG